jgi:hypothetical protein
MERDRIEVESVRPSQCAKFHEDACEKCRIFEGRTISPLRVVVDEKSWTPDEPSEKAMRSVKPPIGLTETTSIIGACDPEAAAGHNASFSVRQVKIIVGPQDHAKCA